MGASTTSQWKFVCASMCPLSATSVELDSAPIGTLTNFFSTAFWLLALIRSAAQTLVVSKFSLADVLPLVAVQQRVTRPHQLMGTVLLRDAPARCPRARLPRRARAASSACTTPWPLGQLQPSLTNSALYCRHSASAERARATSVNSQIVAREAHAFHARLRHPPLFELVDVRRCRLGAREHLVDHALHRPQRIIDSEGKAVHVASTAPGCISPTRQYAQRRRVDAARAEPKLPHSTMCKVRPQPPLHGVGSCPSGPTLHLPSRHSLMLAILAALNASFMRAVCIAEPCAPTPAIASRLVMSGLAIARPAAPAATGPCPLGAELARTASRRARSPSPARRAAPSGGPLSAVAGATPPSSVSASVASRMPASLASCPPDGRHTTALRLVPARAARGGSCARTACPTCRSGRSTRLPAHCTMRCMGSPHAHTSRPLRLER
eukprot:2829955-Prymnesium_polylepis.1